MSTNGGITWSQRQPSSSLRALPPRRSPDVYVDSNDYLYAVGGLFGTNGLNDVWRSTDQGANWFIQGSLPFPSPPGRGSGVLLIHTSTLMQREIMTYLGGYSSSASAQTYHNDIWTSQHIHRRHINQNKQTSNHIPTIKSNSHI